MQVELTELEEELDALDKAHGVVEGVDDPDKKNDWRVRHSIHHENGRENEERKVLVEKITKKLKEYGKIS